MPLTPAPVNPLPGYWQVFGHSYFMTTAGSFYQSGRMDAIFRNAMDIEHQSWQNHAVTGAAITVQGRNTGGFARVLQEVVRPVRGAPYAGTGGGLVLCYGINDIGNVSNSSQVQTAFGHALRTCISRWRAAVVFEDTDASIVYGAGYTNIGGTADFTSGTSVRKATTVGGTANFTITLPADYNGQTIAVCFVGSGGAFGGDGTFTGTASFASGTLTTSNIHPSSHCPVIKRFKGVAADAGKTLIFTTTRIDGSGECDFDCWWIEADYPPPVIVCEIARLLTAGYATYPTWSVSQAGADADVATFNGVLTSVVAEFDGMVQIARLDAALGKTAANFGADGIHPNEYGAARSADALVAAVRQLVPGALGPSASFQPDSPQAGADRRGRQSQQLYLPEFASIAATPYTCVLGDMFAIPIVVTEARERWIQFQLEQTNAPVTSGSSIRWAVFDDVGWTGYPQDMLFEPTAASGALALGTTAAMKVSPTSGSGSINLPIDPGLYWLALKVDLLGTNASILKAVAGPTAYVPTTWAAGVVPAGCAWKLTGQAAGAMPGTFPPGAAVAPVAAAAGVPLIGVKTN